MNIEFIKELWLAITGRTPAQHDIERFKKAVSEALIGSLNGIVLPYCDSLSLWTDYKYKNALKKTIDYLREQLYTQGGASQDLALRLDAEDICVQVGTPPQNSGAIQLASPDLPQDCHIWVIPEMAATTPRRLRVEGAGIKVDLDPDNQAGYTLGRGTESGNMSTMVTITDDDHIISRKQVEIVCQEGKWYCTPIKDTCSTRFQQKDGDYAEPGKKGLLADSKRPKNRIEFSNCGKTIVLQCELLPDAQ